MLIDLHFADISRAIYSAFKVWRLFYYFFSGKWFCDIGIMCVTLSRLTYSKPLQDWCLQSNHWPVWSGQIFLFLKFLFQAQELQFSEDGATASGFLQSWGAVLRLWFAADADGRLAGRGLGGEQGQVRDPTVRRGLRELLEAAGRLVRDHWEKRVRSQRSGAWERMQWNKDKVAEEKSLFFIEIFKTHYEVIYFVFMLLIKLHHLLYFKGKAAEILMKAHSPFLGTMTKKVEIL